MTHTIKTHHLLGMLAVIAVFVSVVSVVNFTPEKSSAATGPTVIYLTSGTSWTVPSDWDSSSNRIEVIGGGGGGTGDANSTGNGGGGGGYSKVVNLSLTPGQKIVLSIGSSGAGDGGDTWFNGSTLAGSSVGAKGGASTGAGGLSSGGLGTTKYSGGAGSPGGGGGGAAGPNGNGGDASDISGGTGRGVPAGNGGDSGSSPSGGNYGGGGAGGSANMETAAGTGAGGIIMITYAPSDGGGSPSGGATSWSSWSGTQSKFTGGNAAWYSWSDNSYSKSGTFSGQYHVIFWNPTDASTGPFDLSFVFASYTPMSPTQCPNEPTMGLVNASQLASLSSDSAVHRAGVFGLYMAEPDHSVVYENGSSFSINITVGSTIHVKRNSSNHFEVYNGDTLVYTSVITSSEPLYVAFGGAFNSLATCSRSVGVSNISMTAATAAAPTCSVTFDQNPMTGNSTMMHWSSTDASLFYINNVGYVGSSGSAQVSPGGTTDYAGSVNGPGGTASCPATLTVTGGNNNSCATGSGSSSGSSGNGVQAVSKTFSYTGGDQTFTVPPGITSITVKMWGAGGVNGYDNGNYWGGEGMGYGGGGGYTTAVVSVNPGDSLTVVVGGNNGVPGGGAGYTNGGNGAGYTGLFRGAISAQNALVIAGAGGGGGFNGSSNKIGIEIGGAGGGTDGQTTHGSGGTQTQGGCIWGQNGCGSQFQGGSAYPSNGWQPTGGGGAGWYGGGGGASGQQNGGGGGGGSGYCGGTGVTACTTTVGNNTTPGNSTDPDLPSGAAVGGSGDGYVIITYASSGSSGGSGGTSGSSGGTTVLTCGADGNLHDSCGNTTSCQWGCSTATNACNTTCQNYYVCDASGTKVVNACDGSIVNDCASTDQICSAGACISPVIGFISFPGSDGYGNPFTATGHLQAIPSLVRRGDSSHIFWNVKNAQSCTVIGSNGDGTSGSSAGVWNTEFSGTSGKTTSAITGATTYALHCDALPGATPSSVQESTTVNIVPSFQEK